MTAQLSVEVILGFADADATYLDDQTRLLLHDMITQGLEPRLVPVTAPVGARGTGELLGVLQLLLLPTLGPKLLDVLQVWLANRKASTVKLKVSRGSRAIEVEYNPALTTWQDIDNLLTVSTSHLTEH
jgi:hypothetical protein